MPKTSLSFKDGNSGEDIFKKLVKVSPNIRMVICGHVSWADDWRGCAALMTSKNDAGKRIDKFLQKALCDIPPALLQKYFRKKCFKVIGKHAKPEDILSVGDEISCYISDEFFGGEKTEKQEIKERNFK